jgi:hypothetical protein
MLDDKQLMIKGEDAGKPEKWKAGNQKCQKPLKAFKPHSFPAFQPLGK